MAQLFFNNAYGFLNQLINETDTTIVLEAVTGLPSTLGNSDWFLMTVYSASGQYGNDHEVIKVTGVTDNGDGTWTLTVERGVEMPALAHGAGDPIEARLTAGSVQEFSNVVDDTVTNTVQTWSSSKTSSEISGSLDEAKNQAVAFSIVFGA